MNRLSLSEKSINRLRDLIEVISPSMQEENMLVHLGREWSAVCPGGALRRDAMGNLEFSVIRNSDYPTIALVAHADTICTQLTCPAGPDKFRFRSIGSNPHMLLGQPVTVINEAGEHFESVVGFDATSQFGQPKGLVFEDLWIDVLENCKDRVGTGDLAVLTPRFKFNGDVVSATALDDRAGLFIITEVLERYAAGDLPVNLICVATVQEEVGLRGASQFDFSTNPDAVVVLDVDYATDIPTPHEDQMGCLYLHAGPGVHRKADNDTTLRQRLKKVADAYDIPLQTSLGRFVYGGTDSTQLQIIRSLSGYKVCNLTIPCRYMHSPVETVSIHDLCAAIELLIGLLKSY